VLDTQCASTDFCARAQNDVSVCAPQPIFVEPIVVVEAPAPKTGCTAVSGSWVLALAVVLALRRR
jgi:hypothetical protein